MAAIDIKPYGDLCHQAKEGGGVENFLGNMKEDGRIQGFSQGKLEGLIQGFSQGKLEGRREGFEEALLLASGAFLLFKFIQSEVKKHKAKKVAVEEPDSAKSDTGKMCKERKLKEVSQGDLSDADIEKDLKN